MGYSNGQLESEEKGVKGEKGDSGLPGIGFKLTDDGDFDIDEKRLTDVADSINDGDAVNLKVLKGHTQFSQNNYHLQPSFRFYRDFGSKSQLTSRPSPSNIPSNHFFQNRAHNDSLLLEKEGFDTGFNGQAWTSIKMKGDRLESGSYWFWW